MNPELLGFAAPTAPAIGKLSPHGEEAIALSVVVPVYNQVGSIVHNIGVIRDRVSAGVGAPIEVIVVSDGSIDQTQERLMSRDLPNVRVLHYDRNLGKGYAVKVGALESRGRWVGYVDADLDLDPAGLAEYMHIAERDGLDFAIGSKRHPDSRVVYPRSRRVASWLFQQFVRLLFRLNVRDTQVGLKIFRREVAEQVFPMLLVKRYAFDIELLAVGRAFGFRRLRELPISLDYQFTGSGVRPAAVAVALVDTLAVFYRLRILRTYQRKRDLVGPHGWTRPSGHPQHVTIIAADKDAARWIDWPNYDLVLVSTPVERREAAESASGKTLAFIEPGAVPSGNFVSATVPFLAREEVAAVVTSNVAPVDGSVRERAAAAVRESRIGGGSLYYRSMPGNIRYVREFPSESYVVRAESLLRLPREIDAARVPAALVDAGDMVVYTPEAFLVKPPPPLFAPHLVQTFRYGRSRGERRPKISTVIAFGAALFIAAGWLLSTLAWLIVLVVYICAAVSSGALAAVQFRSLRVGALAAAAIVPTHVAYLAGYLVGTAQR